MGDEDYRTFRTLRIRLGGYRRFGGQASRTYRTRVSYTGLVRQSVARRTAARTLCKVSLRTASGPEGSSAK